jgi:Domain of unknown function (DUF3387)
VAQNEPAVTEMGTGILADIARDLVRTLRRDVTTDWVSRNDVRASIRTTVKRLLARYGYVRPDRMVTESSGSAPAAGAMAAPPRSCRKGRRYSTSEPGARSSASPGYGDPASASTSRIASPYLASFISPTPLISESSASVAGRATAIWRSVASLKTM